MIQTDGVMTNLARVLLVRQRQISLTHCRRVEVVISDDCQALSFRGTHVELFGGVSVELFTRIYTLV